LGWPAIGRIFGLGSNEDGELEPSLGWTGNVNQASRNCLGDGKDFEKDDSEREPSLGAIENHPYSQEGWSWWHGSGRDLEDDHDGREPDHDNEGTERIPNGGP
jgi:hypothetical protein